MDKSILEEGKDFIEKDNYNKDSLQRNYIRKKSLKYPSVTKNNFSNTFVDKLSIVSKFLENKSEKKGKTSEFVNITGSKTVLKTSYEFFGSKEINRPNINSLENTNKYPTCNSSLNKLQSNVPSNTPVSPKNQQKNILITPGIKILNELKPANESINNLVLSPSLNLNDNVNLLTK